MKLGTERHPKFGRLMEMLHTSRPTVAGILELLWHATAEYAPQGDIGRFDNAAIAKLIGWRGSPDTLVDALVSTGWLDPCQEHRLLIHHWRDHAPDFLRKRLDRGKLTIFQAITPTADNGGLVQTCPPTVASSSRYPTQPNRAVASSIPATPPATETDAAKGDGKRATDSHPPEPAAACLPQQRLTDALGEYEKAAGDKKHAATVLLVAVGMALKDAVGLGREHPPGNIVKAVRLALKRKASNPPGMVRDALKRGWT